MDWPQGMDGKKVEDFWRSHQVPLAELATIPSHVRMLEAWLKSYKPEELFDKNGTFIKELAEMAPTGERVMGANPHANGGILLKDLRMPDFRNYAVPVSKPATITAKATRVLGEFLRKYQLKLNMANKNFRVMGPD